MSRLLLPITLFLVMLLWGCCPPTSLHPLSSAEQADYDQRLEGAWELRDVVFTINKLIFGMLFLKIMR